MKKTTLTNLLKLIFLFVFVFQSVTAYAQLPVPFTPRLPDGSIKVKGDIVLIGNNIITAKDLPLPYNGTAINNRQEGAYVNVANGGDTSIFSSSSADLDINNSCKRILYAGLYWASVYPLEVANNPNDQFEGTPRLEDWNQIKFKIPNGDFIDLIADNNVDPAGEEDDIIFDGFEYYGSGVTNSFKDSPIVCYKNVTNLLQGLEEADGTYTVANQRATRGYRTGGCSAGWTLVVIYESPLLPSKFISLFDGYAGVQNTTQLDIPVSGFQTLPAPLPVKAHVGVAALEGDFGLQGDSYQFKANNSPSYVVLSDAINQANNFFNSTITRFGSHVTNRNPASLNTLGLDINDVNIPNPNNVVLPNDVTAGDLRLTTSGDGYGVYLTSFAVDIIEPDIRLTKIVEDPSGNDISNQYVNLGDELNYVIGFQNLGNDNAKNLIIRDILPVNIEFNYPDNLADLPDGVSVQSYNPATRELIFQVDDSVVKINDPELEIRFKVNVVRSCSLLSDACANNISNQAFVTYNGTINSEYSITDDPSFSSNTGCLITPQATNFLADLDCSFEEDAILCGSSTVLTAGNGYDTYSWSTNPSGSPVIGTNQSLTVTQTGTYYVHNTAVAPCQSIDQIFNVQLFGSTIQNPLLPFGDQVVICPNDGEQLPNFYLCGLNDTRFIQTGINDTTSIIWEQLDETSCSAVINQNCANESDSCIWNQVQTGPDYLIDTKGQYRITLNYEGGCFNQFYFNVYSNVLEPTASAKDIICTTPGEITVNNVPSGYEFSIDGANYQGSNTFSIRAPGIYMVYIRQVGVTPNPCIFTVPDIQVRSRNFSASHIITQPYCNGGLGSVYLSANDARPKYYFSISKGGNLVNTVGPITNNYYNFYNLNPGIYTFSVSTEDGCLYSEDIEIINPPLLKATAALTKPLTCTDGEITVYPEGGTPPYFYFVNSATDFQTEAEIPVVSPGVFNITVVDSNNCSAETSITVDAVPEPEFTISQNNILCAEDDQSGSIAINVSNAHGNALQYSIDNGTTFYNSSVFMWLSAGDYEVVIQYTSGSDDCFTASQMVTITTVQPIIGTAALTTSYTCTSNGVITVSDVSGGTAPYSYSIDGINYQLSQTFSGLQSGTYTVIIRDSNNCSKALTPITIDQLNPPSDIIFSASPLDCISNTSDVSLAVTGGSEPLEYQISGPSVGITPYQSSNVFPGLMPGTYTFRVRDANNCTYAESYTIQPLPSFTVNTNITKALDCTTSPNGTISGTISGGAAPYSYQVSYNSGVYGTSTAFSGNTFSYTASTDGMYQFLITDTNGCTTESGVQTINPISPPEITSVVQTQFISCQGDSSAAIQVNINNVVGAPAFQINVYNLSTSTEYGNQTSGLPAGDYRITLTDANSCTDIENITISEPQPIIVQDSTLPITCNAGGVSFGSVIVESVTGGTPPYNYYVTGTNGYSASELNASGTTSTTFNVVDFGIYQIYVVDANGCSVLVQDVLVASPPNDLDININSTANCITGGEAEVSIGNTMTSSGPFYFDIYRGSIPSPPPGGTWQAEDALGSKKSTFTGLISGVTYTFVVYDMTTGCFYYEKAVPPIPTNSTLTVSAFTFNNITCVGSADGNVSFDINSSYGVPTTVNYEIYNALSLTTTGVSGSGVVPAGGTISISNLGLLPFGNYVVIITETIGPNALCSVVSPEFNITESAIELGISATVEKNANCNPNSGVIFARGENGTPPYSYQVTTSTTTPSVSDPLWTSSNTFSLDANSYYVHVKDAYNCIKTTSVIDLPQDPEPVITAILVDQCDIEEGQFEITVDLTTSGIAPHSYSVDGGAFQTRSAPFTISNLNSGIHTFEVRDANGCGNSVSVTIEAPLYATPDIMAIPTCNDNDGEITISATGGSGSYNYAISPSPASVSLSVNVFSGVPSGTYTIITTDNVTGCSVSSEIYLQETTAPIITPSPTTTITCFGDTNGELEFTVSGYTGNYTYEVLDNTGATILGPTAGNTSTNPLTVSGLSGGNYSIRVTETDSPFCVATSNVIMIASPSEALVLSANETSNVTCDNNAGTITATATGGWGSYEYELTGSATVAYSSNGTFRNLSAGTYTVNVRDAGGCIASQTLTLVIPPPITAIVTANTTTLTCFGDTDAVITVSGESGGQGSNYSYILHQTAPTVSSSGPQASGVFSGLGAGTYRIEVIDGYNCSYNSPDITITEPTEIQADLVKSSTPTCTTDAQLTLSASGGTGPYQYSDDPNFGTVLGSFTSSTTFSVTPGTYQYYVRDAMGCVANASNAITVDPLPPLVINLDLSNARVNCAGDSTGVIVAEAEGGLGNYVYTLQDGSGNAVSPVTQDSPGVFTNLPAGTYQVVVSSGDCLETSAPITITEPAEPLTVSYSVTNAACFGDSTGILDITASGGTGVIKYAISPRLDQFFDTSSFDNLPAGTYQALVQDELGCYVIFDFEITEPAPVSLSIVPNSIVPEACTGDMNGAFSVEITGGTLPYSVSLDNIDGPYTTGGATQTQFDFTGLAGGNHIVYVMDAQGCFSEWNIDFPASVQIEATVAVEYCRDVNDASTNTVIVTVDDSLVDLNDIDYSLDGGAYQVSNTFTDVVPGNHYITVRHTNTCEKQYDFTVDQYDPLTISIADGELNQVVIATTGGSGDYDYTVTLPNGTTESIGSEASFYIYESGNYTVTVTDSNGCIASASGYFEYIDICITNYFTPNGDGQLDEWGPDCANQFPNLTYNIYDRYGRRVATLRQGQKWDGKYDGKELPTGDYWYVIELNDSRDERSFVGHFTLYR
ncbi:T9SS type B sorting domain-containing protein [Gaetbulibacter sp. M240]|uniref:T9SS type B sorting domain-containing protein n=1 Tax=Gaetbulibacter sp. M240 TaxID=3126511 RepID=UPI00374F96BE